MCKAVSALCWTGARRPELDLTSAEVCDVERQGPDWPLLVPAVFA